MKHPDLGSSKPGTRAITVNGVEFHLVNNEVYVGGKRVATYQKPPRNANLLRLANLLKERNEVMATAKKKSATKSTRSAKAAKKTTKASPKKAKPSPKVAEKNGAHVGFQAKSLMGDVKWTKKKVALFKILGKAKSSMTSNEIANVSKGTLEAGDVRHYCYHAHGAGLVKCEKFDDNMRTFYFSLTDKGRKIDPDKALADQK